MAKYVKLEDVITLLENKRLTVGKNTLSVEYACADIQEKVESLSVYDTCKVIDALKKKKRKVSECKLPHSYYSAVSLKLATAIVNNGGLWDGKE